MKRQKSSADKQNYKKKSRRNFKTKQHNIYQRKNITGWLSEAELRSQRSQWMRKYILKRKKSIKTDKDGQDRNVTHNQQQQKHIKRGTLENKTISAENCIKYKHSQTNWGW